MNSKTLIGLAIAALVALVLAVVVSRSNRPLSENGDNHDDSASWLAPMLRDHVNDVSKVVVTGAGDKTIATLERTADGWHLKEKGGYPVDTGKLRAFLLKLADARLVEQKTSSKEKYPVLGVEDVSAADAKGLMVEVSGLAAPLKLIVGNAGTHGGGSYVRRVGETQSWQASANLAPDRSAADWLNKEIANIAATRIRSVQISRPDGSRIAIAKEAEGDANFKLADIPKGREAASEYSTNGLASLPENLRFDDVMPAHDAAPDDKALKASYRTFDGLVLDVIAWSEGGKSEAQLVASLDSDQADRGISAAQAKAKAEFDAAIAKATPGAKEPKADTPPKPLAVSDPAADRKDRLARLDKEVADLNARVKGWTYVLPSYKYASIDKSLADLLKPLAETKSAAVAKKKPSRKSGR